MNFYSNDNQFNFYSNDNKFFNSRNNNKKTIYSAGILPYQVNNEGKVYILLGKDNQGTWSDFGGRSELKDNNNIIETASREFFEESLNSVINFQTARESLKNENNFELIISKTLNGSPYYMFILRLPMKPELTRKKFLSTLEFLKYTKTDEKWIEKNDIQWVSLDTILHCLEDQKNETTLGWPLRKVFRNTLLYNKHILSKLKYKKT